MGSLTKKSQSSFNSRQMLSPKFLIANKTKNQLNRECKGLSPRSTVPSFLYRMSIPPSWKTNLPSITTTAAQCPSCQAKTVCNSPPVEFKSTLYKINKTSANFKIRNLISQLPTVSLNSLFKTNTIFKTAIYFF